MIKTLVNKLVFIVILAFNCAAYGLEAVQEKKLWDQSLELYQREDFERSRNLLLYLVKAQPQKALYWFNLGNSYFMLQDYVHAESCFYKVEALRSPLNTAARLYRSKAAAARGDGETAQKLLHSLLRFKGLTGAIYEEATKDLVALQQADAEPGSPADEALELYKAGKYKRALRLLARQEPDDNIRLLKALVLIKLDREDRAHEILSRLETNEPGIIRDMARTLIDRIRSNYSKPKWLFVESALGMDTNIYRANSADSGTVLSTNAGGGLRFWSDDLWYGTAGYTARWRETFSHSDLATLANELRANAGRELSADLVLVSPFVTHEMFAGKAARLSKGLTVRLRTGDEGLEFGVESELSSDSALNDDLEYLAGTVQHHQIYAGGIFFPLYARAFIVHDRLDIGDQTYTNGDLLPSAYRSLGAGARLLWRIRRDWAAEGALSFAAKNYPTLAKPGNELREDKETVLSARITKIFSGRLSAYAGLTQTTNKSTLGATSVSNESYSQLQVLVGGVWDAL